MRLFDLFKKNKGIRASSPPAIETELQIRKTREATAKITHWLTINANKIIELSLQSGAKESQLKELETLIGKRLPEDFKEMYRLNNGMDSSQNMASYFYGMDFFPIDRIINELKREINLDDTIKLKKSSKEIDTSNIHNPNWLRFGFDGAHTSLFLDFSPSKFGKVGQVIFIDEEYQVGILVANSIAELLKNFANDCENGLYSLSEDALEDDCHFLELKSSIDIVNWIKADRWKAFETN